MRSLVGIRTHRWTDEEERLYQRLHPVLGDDLVAVVHNPSENFKAPIPIVPMTDAWVANEGLRHDVEYGWLCGDYAFYALRAERPDYDFYWLVEPDVYFSSSPDGFFKSFDTVETDLLGLDPRPFHFGHRWTEGMPGGMDFIYAIFALTRMSGRALDTLKPLRVEMGKRDIFKRKYPNDELFSYSHVNSDPDLTVGNLRDHAAEWFQDSVFDTEPDMLINVIEDKQLSNTVLHPVRSIDAVKSSLAKRLTGRTIYVQRMSETFAYFTDQDIDDVLEDVKKELRHKMAVSRNKGRRAK